MALFRKLFYRKPPDGLLEICERVYVFDCCFTSDALEEVNYGDYMRGIVVNLKDQLPDSSVLVFNFHDDGAESIMANIFSEYDITIMDYPRHYQGCPVLPMEFLHHFLRSCESWLSLGQNNLLLMHCERGGWPVLAFMLAALLLYRKQYSGEYKTLDMIYKQAPRELLHLYSPLNPIPSQLRYLQYVSRRNVASEWPPLDRALTLDCVIIRFIPSFDRYGGCRPIFRIFGQDPLLVSDRATKVLYSTPKRSKIVRAYKQAECELLKIDINCHVQGDVLLECISLSDDMEQEETMFRVMFGTAFIRSNILMLNRDEIDIMWNSKDKFPKNFRVEVLLSEMDAAESVVPVDLSCFDEEGLPVEAFARVQEIFSHVDWLDPKADATLNVLQQISASNVVQELLNSPRLSPRSTEVLQEREKGTLSPLSPLKIQSSDLDISPPKNDASKKEDWSKNSHNAHELSSLFTVMRHPTSHIAAAALSKKSVRSDHDSSSNPGLCHMITESVTVSDPILDVSPVPESVVASSVSISPPTPPKSASLRPTLTASARKIIPSPPPLPPPHIEASFGSSPPAPHNISSGKAVSGSFSNAASFPPDPVSSLSTPHLQKPPVKEIPTVMAGPPRPPPPPPPPSVPPLMEIPFVRAGPPPFHTSISPPPPNISLKENSAIKSGPPPTPPPPPRPEQTSGPPPPPPPPLPPSGRTASIISSSGPPPSPPLRSGKSECSTTSSGPSPPPPPPPLARNTGSKTSPGPPPPPIAPSSKNTGSVPFAPPPPAPSSKGKTGSASAISNGGQTLNSPTSTRGRLSHTLSSKSNLTKKLKPLHWLKLSRAVQGSLWEEAQKSGEASKAPEIDMSELESLFSAAVPNSDHGGRSKSRSGVAPKSDIVQLVEVKRAQNCEIMLSKVKVPLHDLMNMILALEDSALDADQIDNLIKFCPTKEETELLKGYTGEKEKLGKCEQFFLELMKVPRAETKLRVFSFKIQFCSQVSDLRTSLNIVNSAAEEIRNSAKLKRIMQTILSLGNALNQGTARGSAIGFRLDSLLKLTDTRARNNKMTLMHYLCKVLVDKLPELLDFSKDLASLEPSSKIQLKFLAEEMQAISKGLEKVVQELASSESDGPVSEKFCKTLKEFLHFAEAEVRSLASLYSGVGRNVDALILYFGEDPSRCPFEQVVSTLLNFVRMFNKAHQENSKLLELEAKKVEKLNKPEKGKLKTGASEKDSENWLQTIRSRNVK